MSDIEIAIVSTAIGWCFGLVVGILHERFRAATERQEVQS